VYHRCDPPSSRRFHFVDQATDERFRANAPVQFESDKGHPTALLSWVDAHKELGNRATVSREGNMPIIENLRVCPDTLGRITKFSKHEPN
jgi:hypothetical protein